MGADAGRALVDACAPLFVADYNRRFARAPQSTHDAHRPLRPHDALGDILRCKEQRKLTHNLTVHYRRSLYIVAATPVSLALRGKLVDVHETDDGTVMIRHDGVELAAVPFRKDGRVRQQDIDDNKELADVLRVIQSAQLARDAAKRTKPTLRERRLLALPVDSHPPDQR